MHKRLFLLLSWLLLSACVRLPEHLPGSHLAHDTQIRQILAQTVGHDGIHPGPWPRSKWWESAQLPALNQLIQAALQDNPSLQVASARILRAKSFAAEQHAALLPQWNASTSFTQEYFSTQGLHLQANGQHFSYTEINPLELRYHLDLWGRDSDQVRAALGKVRVHQADYAEAKLQLETQLTWHYFLLIGISRRLNLAKHLESLQKSLLQLENQRWHDGLADARPVFVQEEHYAEARQSIAQLQGDIAQQRYILAALAGHGPDWGEQIQIAPLPELSRMPIPHDLPLRLISHRPDIVAARWEMEIAAQQIKAARAAFYPDVNIALFAGWNSIDLGDLFSPGNLAHAVGPVITLPVFEGGKLRAHLKVQNAVYMATQDHYRHRILRAVREIARYLAIWKKIHRQMGEQAQIMKATRQNRRLAEAAFRAGTSNKIAVYQTLILEMTMQSQDILLQTQNAQSWALLHGALGGGYAAKGKTE
ncbi:efflux transporter outer membrane subunit [Acidithiobacillus sp. M4-SHS-6]|uniref:efflux transporter outer membrane subunit n=1 Tax=Acidithiobacillus sp. M4-SHS-6 TaxID=3383024 RepID=UPI0039BDA3B6